jgi:hypothetical protein
MEFDGDHPGAGPDQRRGQCAESGTDIQNELTGPHLGGVDDPLRPPAIERMPSPGPPILPGPGHDGPSRSS